MGKHHRQREIQQAGHKQVDIGLDMRPPLADGELNGVQVRWIGPPAPFTRRKSKDVA
jgi:hypothetical protein